MFQIIVLKVMTLFTTLFSNDFLFVYIQLQLCGYVVRTTCAACERTVVTVERAMTTLVFFERWNKVRRCLSKEYCRPGSPFGVREKRRWMREREIM